ncbi:hypothetical protein Hypma_003948 [Hypsizygus marmoreus]|uniref:Uncharacterized protein n=1 Tax=Hypsizygus marmoreus TaxID=39966 RepID=A0A369J8C5_HYPMA|nr:hypothetical protein Hypma_003948 [Hypsizygus marmoreus]
MTRPATSDLGPRRHALRRIAVSAHTSDKPVTKVKSSRCRLHSADKPGIHGRSRGGANLSIVLTLEYGAIDLRRRPHLVSRVASLCRCSRGMPLCILYLHVTAPVGGYVARFRDRSASRLHSYTNVHIATAPEMKSSLAHCSPPGRHDRHVSHIFYSYFFLHRHTHGFALRASTMAASCFDYGTTTYKRIDPPVPSPSSSNAHIPFAPQDNASYIGLGAGFRLSMCWKNAGS